MNSYSQIGQDIWVMSQAKNKTFVEAGALDGILFSNTKLLEENGWKGVCCEPVPESFDKLIKARNCVCDSRCLYPVSDVWVNLSIPEFRNEENEITGYWPLCGLEEYTTTNLPVLKLIKVATVTLQDLLKGWPKEMGYLSLDIEGGEYEVLEAFDWSHTFDCITVEHNRIEKNMLKIRELLLSKGYEHEGTHDFDDWYKLKT